MRQAVLQRFGTCHSIAQMQEECVCIQQTNPAQTWNPVHFEFQVDNSAEGDCMRRQGGLTANTPCLSENSRRVRTLTACWSSTDIVSPAVRTGRLMPKSAATILLNLTRRLAGFRSCTVWVASDKHTATWWLGPGNLTTHSHTQPDLWTHHVDPPVLVYNHQGLQHIHTGCQLICNLRSHFHSCRGT
jgi:hypothetical protein